MAYVKNTWVDREGQTRYHETIDDDGALIFTPDYEKVTELGTPVNADNMNHIEDGIVEHENRITVLEDANNASNFLNKSQITNCILEVPQRIKLELNNGTLTLKAGSVVIVPYGTTDRRSEFPVGANFINSNFEVFDTSYNDNRFFVLAKTKKDISRQRTETPDGNNRFITVYMDGTINGAVSAVSGTTFSNQIGYNTSTNEVRWYNADGTSLATYTAFPIGIVACNDTYVFSSIKQVFNGMGYIGSTFWVEKGFKGLMPNGRNPDGSFNNTELALSKIRISNFASNFTCTQAPLCINNNGAFYWGPSTFYGGERPSNPSNYFRWYNEEENWWYEYVNGWYKKPVVICGYANVVNGVIKEFNPYTTLRAVDYNEFNNLREDVDNKVSKSGDTMTGQLVVNTTDGSPIVIKGMGGVNVTVNPTSTKYYGIQLEDVNGVRMGRLEGIFNANGTIETSITANKTVNGTVKYANFRVGVDANGKAIYSHPQITSPYQNGTSGYNIWSNGYCEQWGVATGGANKTGVIITLLKTYKDTNYCLVTSVNAEIETLANAAPLVANCFNKKTSSFNVSTVYGGNGYNYRAYPFSWYTCGYLASGQY